MTYRQTIAERWHQVKEKARRSDERELLHAYAVGVMVGHSSGEPFSKWEVDYTKETALARRPRAKTKRLSHSPTRERIVTGNKA